MFVVFILYLTFIFRENSDKEDEDIEGMESLAAAIKIQVSIQVLPRPRFPGTIARLFGSK